MTKIRMQRDFHLNCFLKLNDVLLLLLSYLYLNHLLLPPRKRKTKDLHPTILIPILLNILMLLHLVQLGP